MFIVGKRGTYPKASGISRGDRKRNRLDKPRAIWEENESSWNEKIMQVIWRMRGFGKGSL